MTRRELLCDTFIVVSQTKSFGHIIESNIKNCDNNIFEIYDMPLSELDYIKRESGSPDRLFAALTGSERVMVFSKLNRSASFMGVCCISLECMKYISNAFEFISASPTLTRRLRRCQADKEYPGIYGHISLFCDGSVYDETSSEFIYRRIMEYSSVYGVDVAVSSFRSADVERIGAVLSGEILNLFLHCLFIISVKSGAEKIDMRIDEIADRAIIHSQIKTDISTSNTQRLDTLKQISDALWVSLKYKIEDNAIKISVCPYFTDDSQQGLKSKILFEF